VVTGESESRTELTYMGALNAETNPALGSGKVILTHSAWNDPCRPLHKCCETQSIVNES
jgi:hypothetical protein